MWFFVFILIIGRLFNSTLSLDSSKPSLEFKDLIQTNKYNPATRRLVGRILKAIQIYDCYYEMVSKKRVFSSKLSATAFDALRGLKSTQETFTDTISKSLVDLKGLHISLNKKPDIVEQIDAKNKSCFMGGKMYRNEDCEDCRLSIPGFKSKAQSLDELRQIILDMQITIPKQFLYYGNDIFVIMAEAIRIMDKMWRCLETEMNTTKCESRDKSIVFFTKKMGQIATKEDDHVKMVIAERTKLRAIVAQLILEVEATMDGMANCLHFKSGVSLFDMLNKGLPFWGPLSNTARNAGVNLNKISVTDTKRVEKSLPNTEVLSIGSKIARFRSKTNSTV